MKHYILSLLLLAFGATMNAQTDVTDRISDPDFEKEGRSEWKTNSFGRQGNNDFPLKHGGYYREVWSGGTAMDSYLYQDLANMPIGTYTLTMTCQNIKQSNTSQVCTGAWIYINDQKTDFNKPGDYTVTCVVTDGNVRIGAEIKNCTGNYVCVDNCRLSYTIIFEDVKDQIYALIEKAEKMDQHDNSTQEAELVAAHDALKALADAQSNEGMDAAYKRLDEAITAYGYYLASPSNPFDMTKLINNPSFEAGTAGWTISNMGTQTNSDFRGKVGGTYLEKWTDRGNHIDDGYAKQTITGIPNGRYKVTAAAQNIQQDRPTQSLTGCYLIGNESKTEVGVQGNYSLEFVSVTGQVTIGLQNSNAMGNYICVDDFHLYYLGADKEAEAKAFTDLVALAEKTVKQDMNTSIKNELTQAIADAKALSDADDKGAISLKLIELIDQAEECTPLYTRLRDVITKGEKALAKGLSEGQDRVNSAILSAQNLIKGGKVDEDKVKTAENYMDECIFQYYVLNGTGTAPKVTTDPTIIVGCNGMVGRMTATGSNIIERGFCWAENPNPTILDHHTNYSQTNAECGGQPLYIMYDVEASTEYWVRAYAMTSTYAVGYGEAVRVITLPQGTTEYTYLWNGDDDHNEWLDNAMQEATAYYNTWTAIKGFHPTANYSPGTETADCSYGGWINVGPWRCNTGTMLHEMMHGTGVGQHGRWWDSNLKDGIWWQGERANRVCHFFEINPSAGNYNCNGDNIHVCFQGNGNDMQQIRSAILMQALYEDGLPAVSDGACPFYSYESIDSAYYFITNNEYGTNTKFLCDMSNAVRYRKVNDTEELLNDSAFAWNILYDKMTGLYRLRNLKTGKYIVHNGTSLSLSKTAPVNNNTIQLMPSRIFREINLNGETMQLKPYWMARGNRVEYPNVLAVSGETATNIELPTLDFTNSATKQFWLILTPEQLRTINNSKNKLYTDRLTRIIEGSKAVAASNHLQTSVGQDDAFLAVVTNIESEKDSYDVAQVKTAVSTLYSNLVDYLPNILVQDSVDVSFMLDDPELNTGTGWENLPEVKNGRINMTNAQVFTATQEAPVKLPKGQYGLLLQGYQRPGALTQAVKDFNNGTNNVSVSMTLNNSSKLIKHIAEGGQEVKLNKGGSETKVAGMYVPSNTNASQAYIAEGLYDNMIKLKTTNTRSFTIGIKNAKAVEGDMVFIEGLTLYYYGNPAVTDIDELENTELDSEIEGYYTVSGMKIAEPAKGITIVKFKDGSSIKVMSK